MAGAETASRAQPGPRRLRAIAPWLALVAGALALAAMVQGEAGWPASTSLELPADKIKPAGGRGWRAAMPRDFRGSELAAERARLLEDGDELPLRIEKIKHVEELGRGRYRATPRTLYFSTADGSDPRENGRRYTVRLPRRPHPALLPAAVALLAAALWMLGWRRWSPPRPGAHPGTAGADADPAEGPGRRPASADWSAITAAGTLLAFAVALAAMLSALAAHGDRSDGWLIVDGVPYSDAKGWVEMADSLAGGRGFNGEFEAHRGGYPLLLGGTFALAGGGSLLLAKLFNAAMLALGAGCAFALARRAFGWMVATILLAGLLLSARFTELAPLTLTEPTGFALAALGLYLMHRALTAPRAGRFLLAGAALALANLVRPFTLLALPLYGAVVAVRAWRGRWGLRRFAVAGAAYVGGALLVFGPWVVRQKVDWGVATLDLNSAVMLYGAAAEPPEGEKRHLAARHYSEGDAAGIDRRDRGARYRFFMGRYREAIAADPAGYRAFLGAGFLEFFQTPGFGGGHARAWLGCAFFGALLWLAARRRFAPIVLFAALWPAAADGIAAAPAWAVLLAATLLGLAGHRTRGRLAIALLAATLVGAGALNAMVGNFALNRGTVFVGWSTFLLAAAGVTGAARLLAPGWRLFEEPRRGETLQSDAPPAPTPWGAGDLFPAALLGFFALGVAAIAAKSAFGARPDPAEWELSPEGLAAAIAEVRGAPPEARYFVGRVRLTEFRWFLSAGRDVGHWARPFEVRPFDRTVVVAQTGYRAEDGATATAIVNLRGDWTREDRTDFILVGIENTDPDAPLGDGRTVIEALALIPSPPSHGAALHFPPPPDLPPPPGETGG